MRSAARQARSWSEEEGDVGRSARDDFDVRQIALCFQHRELSRLFAVSDHPVATKRREGGATTAQEEAPPVNTKTANEMESRLKIDALTVAALVAWGEPQVEDLLQKSRPDLRTGNLGKMRIGGRRLPLRCETGL